MATIEVTTTPPLHYRLFRFVLKLRELVHVSCLRLLVYRIDGCFHICSPPELYSVQVNNTAITQQLRKVFLLQDR